ncbi:hypothetical protein V3C99_017247 [Haemonchus contortus]
MKTPVTVSDGSFMSLITLLYLFCFTSVSDDVASQVAKLSIWQCYGGSGRCGAIPGGPQILNDTSTITAEDLPTENRLVSLDSLLAKLLVVEPNSSHGIVVLEAGNTSYIEWWLSSNQSVVTMNTSRDTNPPLVQQAFVRNLPLYHFNASAYEGVPDEVIVVAPGASLTFLTKELFTESSCHHSALIVAPLKWTSDVAKVFVNQFNTVRVKDCEICSQLPLSPSFIRLCPQSRSYDRVSNKTSLFPMPIEAVIALVEPAFWDTEPYSTQFMVTLNSSLDLPPLAKIVCTLESESGSQYPLTAQELLNNTVGFTLSSEAPPATYHLSCLLNFTNQKRSIKSTYNRTLVGINFTALVETVNGSIIIPCYGNLLTATAMFKVELPSMFNNVQTNGSYCFIDGVSYPGEISGLKMQCLLDNLTISHELNAYFVRSAQLHETTLKKQVPVHLRMICEPTKPPTEEPPMALETPPAELMETESNWDVTTLPAESTTPDGNLSVELSRDLLGFVIRHDSANAFPVGLIACELVIGNYQSLGVGAVCIGGGDHVAVRFGESATLVITDPIIVFGNEVELHVPDGIAYPNFTLLSPSEVMSCVEQVTVEVKQITGNGKHPLQFKWMAENASAELSQIFEAATGRFLSFPTTLLNSEITVVVTACNFAGMCTTIRTAPMRPVEATATLSLTIGGISQSLVPSMAIRLVALPEFSRCNESFTVVPDDAQYKWSVRGLYVTSDDSYRIPAFTYKAGESVEVRVEVYYRDKNTNRLLRAAANEMLVYVPEELVAIVDAVTRSVSSDSTVVIDASRSKNPNDHEGTVTHQWQCMNLTSGSECVLPETIDMKSAVLRIPPGLLSQGKSFNFTDIVRAQSLSGSVWSLVSIGPPRLPQIFFTPFSQDKVSTSEHLRIQAYITVLRGWLRTSWEVLRTPHTSYFNLSTFLKDPNTTFTQEQLSSSNQAAVSLTIPPANPALYPDWSGLIPGMQYTVRLNAETIDGSAYADVLIVVNAPPTVGIVEVSPSTGALALETQIEFRKGDGWSDEDLPLQHRFGIKPIFVNDTSAVYWFPRTGAISHRLYLPAAMNKEPACGKYIGFQAVLEVCDRFHSCSTAESMPFEVSQPPNVTLAVVDMVAAINSYIGNGNIFGALSGMYVIDVQRCEEKFDMVTADKIATKLLMTLDNSSDTNDFREVLYTTSHIMDDLSPFVLEGIILVLERYRSIRGMTPSSSSLSPSSSRRTKREATAASATSDEQEADDMLSMYDLLLEKNQQIVDVYLLNIQDFLSTFCIQLDETSSRIMKAKGGGLTTIQAQSLVPGAQDFSNSSFTIAGESTPVISFSTEFCARFSSWNCGPSMAACHNICLATSQIKMIALQKNQQLMQYFFGGMYDAISANSSVSQLHHIELRDPLSGEQVNLPNGVQYSVYIPLTSYEASHYYACLIFIDSMWKENCVTSSFATHINGVPNILCSCSTAGLLSVFITNPPIPPAYPAYNEIRMTFVLNSTYPASGSQLQVFKSRLASASGVDERRFVNATSKILSKNISQISVILRPPFRITQMTNSYAIQAIHRAVENGSGFTAYNFVVVLNSTFDVVKRNLSGDGNARKVIITIDRSYQAVVGNESTTLAAKWCESIASMLRVSHYRFKNARIFIGIVFNLTITLPFEGETDPLPAEEIAIMMMECSKYEEFDLQSIQGLELAVQPITNRDIIELIVLRQLNTLSMVVIIVMSTIIGIFLLYTGGAVIVKVKTDRLIEEERRKVLRITPAAPAAPTGEMYVMQDLSQMPSTSQEPPRHRIATVSRHQ